MRNLDFSEIIMSGAAITVKYDMDDAGELGAILMKCKDAISEINCEAYTDHYYDFHKNTYESRKRVAINEAGRHLSYLHVKAMEIGGTILSSTLTKKDFMP